MENFSCFSSTSVFVFFFLVVSNLWNWRCIFFHLFLHKSALLLLLSDISDTVLSVCLLRIQEDSTCKLCYPWTDFPCKTWSMLLVWFTCVCVCACRRLNKRKWKGWTPRRSQCFHIPLVHLTSGLFRYLIWSLKDNESQDIFFMWEFIFE